MNNLAEKFGKSPLALSDHLVQECLRYYWPGNLRELGNFVKRDLVLEQEDLVLEELRAKASGSDLCEGFPVPACARGGLKALVRSLKGRRRSQGNPKGLGQQ